MEEKKIRKRAQAGLDSYGLTISMIDPTTVEMAYYAGYNFVRIDNEHVLFDNMTLINMFRTARNLGIPCQIRVETLSHVTSILSLGASAIMVPHVECREQAQEAIDLVKFAPIGKRGMDGGARALRFGCMKRSDYVENANSFTDLIVQIESVEGMEHIDEILSLEGIDMVATGKADLSQSLGVPGQKDHPDVLAAEAFIVKKALEYSKIPTLVAEDKKRVAELHEMGVHCFLTGHDESIANKAIKNNLKKYFD